MKSLFVLSPLLLTLLVFPASSLATTLTFDEFGTSPLLNVDGMHVSGVTFHFSSGSADYNGQIGTAGLTSLVSDPLLTGPTTGTLTFAFDIPTTLLRSDLALLSLDSIGPAYTVVLRVAMCLSVPPCPSPTDSIRRAHSYTPERPLTGLRSRFSMARIPWGETLAPLGWTT
jgi:hypothetical protein